MVAGVVKFYLKLEKLDEGVNHWNSSIAKARSEEPNVKASLQGFALLVDRKTGHCHAIGFWDSAEASTAFGNSKLFHETIGKLEKYCVKPPVREQFEIISGDLENVTLGSNLAA